MGDPPRSGPLRRSDEVLHYVTPFLSSDPYDWPQVGLHGYDLAPHPEPVLLPFTATHNIMLHLAGPQPLTTEHDGGSDLTFSQPGAFAIIPAGTAITGWHPAAARTLHLALAPDVLDEVSDAAGRRGEARLPCVLSASDPLITEVLLALKRDVELGCPLGSLYAETMGRAVALHLLGTHRGDLAEREAGLHLLTADIDRVLAAIEERIAEPLTLAELARLAGYSPSQFLRRFKRAVGLSPHQYLLRRRVLRARDLLAAGRLTVAEVAAATGFADQSHLDHCMQHVLHAAPSAFDARRSP